MLDNLEIYAHPKVRFIAGNIQNIIPGIESKTTENEDKVIYGVVGVSHSSLSQGEKVKFAGTFTHNQEMGWIIENTTGHYATRMHNMPLFLKLLQDKGCNLNNLVVKLYDPINPNHVGANEKDFYIKYENAVKFLERVKKSKSELDTLTSEYLEGLSVTNKNMAMSQFGQASNTAREIEDSKSNCRKNR